MNKLIMEAMAKQKEILESQGYSVAYICLYGSQNYNLDINTDSYKSDIDMKAIIVPTLDDLISNSKPVSTVVDTEWGQCDIKDIRSYFQTLLKANPAYIETLFTDYYIVDDKFKGEFEAIFKNREKLAYTLRAQMLRAMYGMMCEKEKALTHPYPTIAHKIEKYKFDGKQGHHVLRLYTLMQDYYVKHMSLKEALIPQDSISLMMDLKLNVTPFEDAEPLIKDIMSKAKELRDDILEKIDESDMDYTIKDAFLRLSQLIIKNKITAELKGEQHYE